MAQAPRKGDLVEVRTWHEVAYGTYVGFGHKYVTIIDDQTGQERRVYGTSAGVKRISLLDRIAQVSTDT